MLEGIVTKVDIDDFAFLDEVLQDKRIVLLGEQLHNDGTTFEMKARIIKYLHDKLGFNVILYESGLYDMWYMGSRDTLNPNTGVFYFWGDNDECRPLWDYYRNSKQSENPIKLGGFDIQVSGRIGTVIRSQLIENYLSEKGIELDDYPNLRTMIDRIYGGIWWEYKKMENSLYDSIQNDLSLILDRLEKEKAGYIDEVYYRYLSGIKIYNELRWNYDSGNPIRMHIRDSLMADNLIWLVEDVYKNEKIIVWAANIHIFTTALSEGEWYYKPMGASIKDRYKNDVYSMVFTSYARKNKAEHLYNVASNKSVEYLLYMNKNRYSFINLKDLPEDSFLNEDVISTVNQMMNIKNNWKNQFDGVFFIDAITPLNAK